MFTQEEADTMVMQHEFAGIREPDLIVIAREGDGYCRVSPVRELGKFCYLALESLIKPTRPMTDMLKFDSEEIRERLRNGARVIRDQYIVKP